LQHRLYRQTLDALLDHTLTDDTKIQLVETVLGKAIKRLAKTQVEDWIPFVSPVLQLEINRYLLSTTLTAAYREFRLRWLLDHQR
jgi:acyl carrier protein phosphodiesterase